MKFKNCILEINRHNSWETNPIINICTRSLTHLLYDMQYVSCSMYSDINACIRFTVLVYLLGEGNQGRGLVVMVVLGHPDGEDPVLLFIGGLGIVPYVCIRLVIHTL